MIKIFEPNVDGGGTTNQVMGPYLVQDIAFDTGTKSGFQFGDESVNAGGSSIGGKQRQFFSIKFSRCDFTATGQAIFYEDDADGKLQGRLTNTAIGMVCAFESVFEDVSFRDYGVGFRIYGCDKPSINRCRGHAEIPIDITVTSNVDGDGNFKSTNKVQHCINDFQTESWKFTPIRINGTCVAITNLRTEGNRGSDKQGMGKYVLVDGSDDDWPRPKFTATVSPSTFDIEGNQNPDVVVFSKDMTDILIPGLSLIELSDGGENVDTVMVTDVNGTDVTVNGGYFRFTNGYTAIIITRWHGLWRSS